MKFVDEYRDEAAAQRFVAAIEQVVTREWNLMEICGGQTHTLIKSGIDRLLPPEVTLIHGPGCPVCVTPLEMIDRAIALARRPEIILTSFGDMLRVPGSTSDLLAVKAGEDIAMTWDEPGDVVWNWQLYREEEPDPSLWLMPFATCVQDADLATADIQHVDPGALAVGSLLFYQATALNDCGETPLE